MTPCPLEQQIFELEREIARLPKGSLSTKKVKDKKYYYQRYTENGKRRETYVDFDDVGELDAQIAKRKQLETQLRTLKQTRPKQPQTESYLYRNHVRTGIQLENWAATAKPYKHRECFKTLHEFVFDTQTDKIFILYGLRRTGKTTMIRQAVLEMEPEQRKKTAFVQAASAHTLADINADLQLFEQQGFQTIFIDEITLLADFVEGASLFSDIYASSGMKIILSGTDSLAFAFCKSEQLYDRCTLLHTTLIPYREFENVLGLSGIDTFLQHGGLMTEPFLFTDKQSTEEYVYTAIARNIQHSLEHYQDGGHFRNLYDLYCQKELTSAINRVIEDINHRFTKDVLTKTFKSNLLSNTARNLLKQMIELLDIQEQTVPLQQCHAAQIKEYLILLDMIAEIDIHFLPDVNRIQKKIVISQPGIRYAQAKALVDALLADQTFQTLPLAKRQTAIDRTMTTIQGGMLEDLVLLETKTAMPNKQVFQLQFPIGEFDMVIHDPQTLTCQIFEIKHSTQTTPEQIRHLTDPEKLAACQHRYGTITKKAVLYRGQDTIINDIEYRNVKAYLNTLGQ